MTIQHIADDFTAMLKRGAFDAAAEAYWADDVASIEPPHTGAPVVSGKPAVTAKNDEWSRNHEIHRAEVTGPYVNGDQFSLVFALDTTDKTTGERASMEEVALYTVRDGKIVEERFFY